VQASRLLIAKRAVADALLVLADETSRNVPSSNVGKPKDVLAGYGCRNSVRQGTARLRPELTARGMSPGDVTAWESDEPRYWGNVAAHSTRIDELVSTSVDCVVGLGGLFAGDGGRIRRAVCILVGCKPTEKVRRDVVKGGDVALADARAPHRTRGCWAALEARKGGFMATTCRPGMLGRWACSGAVPCWRTEAEEMTRRRSMCSKEASVES
jgi:hypothetical protein